MFRFLRIQYILGKVSKPRLKAIIGNKLTLTQYNEIVGEKDAK